jgi:hypothetical protein
MVGKADPFAGKLFNEFPPQPPYGSNEKYQAHLLEQYKLYVEMADRISARRQSANSYFLAINTGLVGLIGYVTTKETGEYLWLMAGAGMAICYLWYRLIRSYRGLNSGKFKVIHFIEKRLPLSPYDAEWEAIGRGEDPKLYKPFTHIENGVPWVFMALHAVVFIRMLPWRIVSNSLRTVGLG